ncbi:MAG: DivIVA domain-containing protein [Nitrospirae bacterium]|nr:MAG: DivIVA domain-containing protein [Nitrospirota bacterium]
MRVTPLEIEQKKFNTKLRGLDREEVENFLEAIKEDMEELIAERNSLKEKLREVEKELKRYSELEDTMKGLLLSTQKMVNEYKKNAEREAELIIREAKIKAQNILTEAQDKLIKYQEDINELKRTKRMLKQELLRVIESYKKMVDAYSEEEEGK